MRRAEYLLHDLVRSDMTLPQLDLWCGEPPLNSRDDGLSRPGDRAREVWDARPAKHQEAGESLRDDDIATISAMQSTNLDEARAAFERLYRTHAPAIARFAYGYTRSREAAEDIVAEVFLAVWHRRETWAPRHGVRAYLYSAARHRAFNVRRGEVRAARRVEQMPVEQAEDPFAHDERNMLHARLNAAMAALPEEARRLAELRWHEGMSPGEIAAILGIDRSAVDNRLSRLVKRLRALAAGTDETER